MTKKKVHVLFVCLGNICRSPAAEAIFTNMVQQAKKSDSIVVSSRAIRSYSIGEEIDQRMQEMLIQDNISFSKEKRATRLYQHEFSDATFILAADISILHVLDSEFNKTKDQVLALMTEFSSLKGQEIVDPYYRDMFAFEKVYNNIKIACQGLFEHIVNNVLS